MQDRITLEEMGEWLSLPLTQKVLDLLTEERNVWLSQSTSIGTSMEQCFLNSCRRDSMIAAINTLLDPCSMLE